MTPELLRERSPSPQLSPRTSNDPVVVAGKQFNRLSLKNARSSSERYPKVPRGHDSDVMIVDRFVAGLFREKDTGWLDLWKKGVEKLNKSRKRAERAPSDWEVGILNLINDNVLTRLRSSTQHEGATKDLSCSVMNDLLNSHFFGLYPVVSDLNWVRKWNKGQFKKKPTETQKLLDGLLDRMTRGAIQENGLVHCKEPFLGEFTTLVGALKDRGGDPFIRRFRDQLGGEEVEKRIQRIGSKAFQNIFIGQIDDLQWRREEEIKVLAGKNLEQSIDPLAHAVAQTKPVEWMLPNLGFLNNVGPKEFKRSIVNDGKCMLDECFLFGEKLNPEGFKTMQGFLEKVLTEVYAKMGLEIVMTPQRVADQISEFMACEAYNHSSVKSMQQYPALRVGSACTIQAYSDIPIIHLPKLLPQLWLKKHETYAEGGYHSMVEKGSISIRIGIDEASEKIFIKHQRRYFVVPATGKFFTHGKQKVVASPVDEMGVPRDVLGPRSRDKKEVKVLRVQSARLTVPAIPEKISSGSLTDRSEKESVKDEEPVPHSEGGSLVLPETQHTDKETGSEMPSSTSTFAGLTSMASFGTEGSLALPPPEIRKTPPSHAPIQLPSLPPPVSRVIQMKKDDMSPYTGSEASPLLLPLPKIGEKSKATVHTPEAKGGPLGPRRGSDSTLKTLKLTRTNSVGHQANPVPRGRPVRSRLTTSVGSLPPIEKTPREVSSTKTESESTISCNSLSSLASSKKEPNDGKKKEKRKSKRKEAEKTAGLPKGQPKSPRNASGSSVASKLRNQKPKKKRSSKLKEAPQEEELKFSNTAYYDVEFLIFPPVSKEDDQWKFKLRISDFGIPEWPERALPEIKEVCDIFRKYAESQK